MAGALPVHPPVWALVEAIQALSLARDLATVQAEVKRTARQVAHADGATFILRQGDQCYYADEDAIAPLWQGQRFPLTACISGWAMCHREAVVIPDIYADGRIPHAAYRPTFVTSLAMLPVRVVEPMAAIGVYWAQPYTPSAEEMQLLTALAHSTAVAMESVTVRAELETRVHQRTAELQRANAALRVALDEVKTLRGLIPICAWCKQIRDDQGLWHQLEAYLHQHTEAAFSHGICPTCRRNAAQWSGGSSYRGDVGS
jgi:GAF domain-containing protein